MKVLVTGIEGYIGTRLGEVLINAGFDVVGLDSGFYRDGQLYGGVKAPKKIIQKDVRNVEEGDLRGFDAVIHLAELSNDPLGENNPEITLDINHAGTMKLARMSKKAGVGMFIYSSSCSVYGASDDVLDETSPVNPLTTYAKCKILNERGISQLANGNFSPVFLRNATAYGPSPRMRFDLVINNLAGSAWANGWIKMASDGNAWRPFVHVEDICQAMIKVLEAPTETVHNKIFNVGGDNSNYTIKEIAEIISDILPHCKVTMHPDNADKRNYRVNFKKINSQLPGFSAKRDVKDGIRELIALFKEIGMNKETFESKEYYRLKKIKYLCQTDQVNSKFYFKEYAV